MPVSGVLINFIQTEPFQIYMDRKVSQHYSELSMLLPSGGDVEVPFKQFILVQAYPIIGMHMQ